MNDGFTMTELITGITSQPNFPREDLTPENADVLELLMANEQILDTSHEAVERMSWIFRVGHPSILHSAKKVHDDTSRLSAINHGVKSFEAITAMVGGEMAIADIFPTHREASRLLHLEPNLTGNYLDEAMEDFQQETPHTAEVVRSSTARFHGPLVTYAILGAAMSRKFELSVVEIE